MLNFLKWTFFCIFATIPMVGETFNINYMKTKKDVVKIIEILKKVYGQELDIKDREKMFHMFIIFNSIIILVLLEKIYLVI